MIGVNVPIPVPMAYYSFGGWKDSLFGDHHIHGAGGGPLLHPGEGGHDALARGSRAGPRAALPDRLLARRRRRAYCRPPRTEVIRSVLKPSQCIRPT